MGRPLWKPPQGKELDEKPPVPPACLTPSSNIYYNFFRANGDGRTPPTLADNFPSYSSTSSSSSSSSSGGPTLGQTLGLRHSRLTDDDQQRRSRNTRNDDMVMRNDSSMLTLDEFLRETSAASATRDEAERHLQNLLSMRRRIGPERSGLDRSGLIPATAGERAELIMGGAAQWRTLFEHTPAGRRRILGALPVESEYVSRVPLVPGGIPRSGREAEDPRDPGNTGLASTLRDEEILPMTDVSWRPTISRDVEIARATIPRARGDVQITWRPSVSRGAEISQRPPISRDISHEAQVLTPDGLVQSASPPLRDTAVPPVPARRLTTHPIQPGLLQPARSPGLYHSFTPSRTTPTTSWPPSSQSSLPPLSQQDSFDMLVGQIRRIGALQDFMLSSVDNAAASLEESETTENETAPGEDRERNAVASLRVREARLRAMQTRIDLLDSEFALLSNTRRELRRVNLNFNSLNRHRRSSEQRLTPSQVEAEALESLQETSARNRASLQEARSLSLRDARAFLSDADRAIRTQEAVERYIANRRADEFSTTLGGIPVVRVGRRVNVQEGDARWAGGIEAGREGQMGMTRAQREEVGMAEFPEEPQEGISSEGRMTAALREELMRSAVMRMQIEALPTGAL